MEEVYRSAVQWWTLRYELVITGPINPPLIAGSVSASAQDGGGVSGEGIRPVDAAQIRWTATDGRAARP